MRQILVMLAVLAVAGPVAAQDGEIMEIGEWYIEVSVDPMTDNRNVAASRLSDDGDTVLWFMCAGQNFSLIISTPYTPRDYSVRLRFGQAEPSDWAGNWLRSGDGQAVFANARDRDRILEGFRQGERLVFQIRSQFGSETAVFGESEASRGTEALAQLDCAED